MRLNLPKIEEKILKFWKKNKIFEKSLNKTKKGPRFVFFEGPPYANGLPGIHHLLARAFKDVILRYKTMQGFYVERKAGWDTHGLPTEMEAEKKLGIKTKKDIEKLGIEKFIKECKKNVFTYKKEWEEFTERIGFWLDLKRAYITCSNEYIESLWWILKKIWEKGFLYQDYKVVPYCPRCGTSLSSHEVAQGYKKVKENSLYLKFKIISDDKKWNNIFILSWTTTPWTLPGNVALAVNPDFIYLKVKTKKEILILAKERTGILGENYEVIKEIKGRDLIGLSYQPLFNIPQLKTKTSFKIYPADFVTAEEGTGVVHIAVMYGEDDYKLGEKACLPKFHTVDKEGRFIKILGGGLARLFVKSEKAESLILEHLRKNNSLFLEELYEHDYPFCWRCGSPLLYYAKSAWFIKMTAVKKELIENNKKINWVPNYLKEGRFGEWIEGVKDWNLSRERYWGTPLPVWQCQTDKNQKTKTKNQICNNIKVIGSIKELEKLSGKKIKEPHRPFIDKITFRCDKCGKIMNRVPEVVDCWFDSGSMPFAQWHYPFENKKRIDKGISFPADFICEGIDQTRGWFYTLLAISTLLGLGPSYKNVISHGIVLDKEGEKMSKSKGNVIWPKEVISKYGADCARFYFYTTNPVAEPKRFNFEEAEDLYRKLFDTLWESFNFFLTYCDEKSKKEKAKGRPKNLLDCWIISRLENLNSQLIKNLEKYDVVGAGRLFKDFIDDLSNWYIRRSRSRFQRPKTKKIKEQACQTLYYLLSKFVKLMAPFAPFITEQLYQKLGEKEESVHLVNYPKPQEKLIDKKLEEKMKKVREIVVLALALRAKAKIKVRQPLSKLQIADYSLQKDKELLDLIKEEVNVKEIVFGKEIKLDTKITFELREEGKRREIIRNIKELRKRLGLTPEIFVSEIISTVKINPDKHFLEEVGAKRLKIIKEEKEMTGVDIKKEIKLENKKHYLGIKK